MAKFWQKLAVSQKKDLTEMAKPLILLARLAGFEPATCGLEVRCSIQLSYGRDSSSRFGFVYNL